MTILDRLGRHVLGAALLTTLATSSAHAIVVPDSPFYPPYGKLDAGQATASSILDVLQDADASPVAKVFDLQDAGGTVYQTSDGRPLRALKISDNPETDEDEPAFLFVGSIHGREPLGTRIILELIEDLTEGYANGDAEITEWVNAYEIWFVPVMNPYGYEPRECPDATRDVWDCDEGEIGALRANANGVDLNRNFDFRWEPGEVQGSSPFSEPDSRAIRDLTLRERFSFGVVFHSGAGDGRGEIWRPWSNANGTVAKPVDAVRLEHVRTVISDAVRISRNRVGSVFDCPLSGKLSLDSPCRGPGPDAPVTAAKPYAGSFNYHHAKTGMFDYLIETSADVFRTHPLFYEEDPHLTDSEVDRLDLAFGYAESYADGIKGLLAHFLVTDLGGDCFRGPGVTGRVFSSDGQPISATVRIVDIDTTLDIDSDGRPDLRHRQTDVHGRYLRLLSPGAYTLEYSRPGFRTETRAVDVPAASTDVCLIEADMTLQRDFGPQTASGDFDGDGAQDLAVGLPDETVEGARRAGVVKVWYPRRFGGFDAIASTLTEAEQEDAALGAALAVGDFDRDGYDDLAVGSPGADVNARAGAGQVRVFYGSSAGLVGAGAQRFDQGILGLGVAGADNRFGTALAAADFDHDGRDDLAIGVPGESAGGIAQGGVIRVIPGGDSGLAAWRLVAGRPVAVARVFSQGTLGLGAEAGAHFGASLAAGDFDRDGHADLAVGVPDADTVYSSSRRIDSGSVNVIHGSASGLVATRVQTWDQGRLRSGTTTPDAPEAADRFGASLAAGDFNGDGRDDLAIGTPGEDLVYINAATSTFVLGFDAGVVNVVHGGTGGLAAAGNLMWSQATSGITDDAEAGDRFGASLAAGDFNRDGRDDLAVGVPHEDDGTRVDTGAVNVIYGATAGLASGGNRTWSQGSMGIAGHPEVGDGFGHALAAGDFDGDGDADLAVVVAAEEMGLDASASAVNVIPGGTAGLHATGDHLLVP